MIDHFLRAQYHVIDQAIQEILSGKKTGHWICGMVEQYPYMQEATIYKLWITTIWGSTQRKRC